jgi:hypothetical protein
MSGGAIAYLRHAAATATELEQFAMVFLNFSDFDRKLSVPFPSAGVYREMLDDDVRGTAHLDISVANMGDFQSVKIPSNYGQVFVTPALS